MYLRAFSVAALLSAALLPGKVIAAPAGAATPAVTNVCSKLGGDYDQVEKSLALTYAEGVGDNSAPRDTSRKIEESNDLARASMMLTLMQAHHCSLPDHAPSHARYMSNALTCATDMLRSGGEVPPSCKTETWQAK
jgi:hypothetical protein